ncbi:pilus assembly protein [Noviherbaspirillum aridicola]|uniref:Pilus biosynthesis protein n=1 Tax=Noviherbaspirillum aridicola TaxID=2849687 RepID=A0ABQ4Q032_9BURK|nr:PilC/PilY family type IV pilus protein [Noviherbaspirillum aridicola]GIZ50426.1 pilus biosynthesis protein [Noviherbaspirillum aridicola]
MKDHSRRLRASLALLAAATLPATAAITDIATAPLLSAPSTSVKPNIMFILDDSGSMGWEYLPDAAANFDGEEYGSRSSQCNGAYYDPGEIYLPPVDSSGNAYPNASFTAALSNGFNSSSTKVNLEGRYYFRYKGNQAPLSYTYGSDGAVDTNTTFYKECNSNIGNTPGRNAFDKVTVSATSGPGGADERTNFANWYSYYRTRMLAMKSAAGRAFREIGSNYRVGLTTINHSSASVVDILDFDATQRRAWYEALYAADPSGNTPLRAALSRVGKLYAGKTGNDPVQYSCQQNFAILSTDGYWNGGEGSTLRNRSVGNQDGDGTPRPMYDGSNTANTLADVAMYYYKTDLRAPDLSNCNGALGTDVCLNNVKGSGRDNAAHQHMTTMTLGLGINGTLKYHEDYLLGMSPDFKAIEQGTRNWPKAEADSQTAVDDLWHAAVNGRGIYFSAQSPNALVSGISKALAEVKAETGSGAGAATSNLQPVPGDSYVYIARYTTVSWDGDVQAREMDPATGKISKTVLWSAQALLDTKVGAHTDQRTIFTHDPAAASGLKPFNWTSLSTAEKAYFSGLCGTTTKLSQCSSLDSDAKAAATGENLVNFLRGQRGYEDQAGSTQRVFRDRAHALGDIIGSQPVYIRAPRIPYVDANHDAYRSAKKNRQATLFVGANDGMVHAFNATTGQEMWAYIPPIVLPELYRLADRNYAANHRYYVDGTLTVADICPRAPAETCRASEWKTILVGGLNAGGRGYYALDVTDPTSPKALWHFTVANDSDLGYSFGNPMIGKRRDGTWIVAFTSGYNNVSPGTGRGFLFVLNADTGAVLEKIDTGVGGTATPSGLGKLNGWVNSVSNNTIERFYAGDLLGNLWRFDIDNAVPPAGKEALLLAELGNTNGAGTQPVTIKPVLTEVNQGGVAYPVVHVATGRYLGISDLDEQGQQSIYAIKDPLTAAGHGQVRRDGVLVRQTLSPVAGQDRDDIDDDGDTQETVESTTRRTTSTQPVNWREKAGWYVDLNPGGASPGERVNIDMQQQLGILTVIGNVPHTDACTSGGTSWIYNFDFKTGQFVPTADGRVAGTRYSSNTMIVGNTKVSCGSASCNVIVDGEGEVGSVPDPVPGSGSGVRRVSWRELLD